MDYTILVNKENPIDNNYKIENLVSVGKNYNSSDNCYSDEDILLEKTASIHLQEMIKEANKIDSKIIVIPDSGYRSISYQQGVMDYYIKNEGVAKARERVATPGTSEHHTALAIDIAIFDNGVYKDDVTGEETTIKFLHNNCYKYGFILRYPKRKENITGYRYEPWHFRYVGKDLAKYLYDNNLTLEEYYKGIKDERKINQ